MDIMFQLPLLMSRLPMSSTSEFFFFPPAINEPLGENTRMHTKATATISLIFLMGEPLSLRKLTLTSMLTPLGDYFYRALPLGRNLHPNIRSALGALGCLPGVNS